MALSQRFQKSLTTATVSLRRNNLSNEALAEIIDALSVSGYKQLKTLYAEEELIRKDE